jgi:ABC-type molybdate transport system substrate-binding protein
MPLRAAIALVALFSIALPAQVAEITVLAGMGVISAVRDLAPAFEKKSGH